MFNVVFSYRRIYMKYLNEDREMFGFYELIKCERDVKILIRSGKIRQDKEVKNETEKDRIEWREK